MFLSFHSFSAAAAENTRPALKTIIANDDESTDNKLVRAHRLKGVEKDHWSVGSKGGRAKKKGKEGKEGSSEDVPNDCALAFSTAKPPAGDNPCAGKGPALPNVECVVDALVNVGPQSGANVTKGYVGSLAVDHSPTTNPFWMQGMCPVNVHWTLGTEHYSLGEYDENGVGPPTSSISSNDRRRGFRCNSYNETDIKFTQPYTWKHCIDMEVGETYEVQWPHSAAGACGTLNQYQSHYNDGVFCRDGVLTDTVAQIGVQAQVFTIVNDEEYFYPDLMRGMIVDGEMMGLDEDIAKYTGSYTGADMDNVICSQFSPITWHVDRKCHLISASSFDKMCADMKGQRDDMSNDLSPHGSRELVADRFVANNQVS